MLRRLAAPFLLDISPLRDSRSFRLLWIGQLISLSGTHLRLVAVPYQVYLLTGSSFDVGLLGLFQAVPLISLSLFGGVIADRVDRRRLLVVTQTALAATSLVLALATQLSIVNLPLLYGLVAVAAAFSAIDNPARGSLVPNLVQRRQLAAAITLQQVLFQSAAIAGPALAGIVIVSFGVAGAYWIDAASFGAAIAAVVLLTAPPRTPSAPQNVARSLAEGISYLRSNRILFATMSLDFLATFFGSPRALFPYYADRVFRVGPEGLGLLFAAPGIGSLLAALASGWVPKVRRQGLAVLLAVTGWGLAIAAFGALSDGLFPLGLGFVALAEAADTVSAIFRITILQTFVPDALRGRLTAINSMFVIGGPTLGQVESGAVATVISPEFAVVSGGLACIGAVGLIATLVPELATYRSEPATTEQAPA
ncbi:MAG: MFS transporter [Chloroflexi bacterium]|nr:MAG: MFS transporter [Chloroflexota bacterium]